MKKIFLLVSFQTLAICTYGQVLFSNSCGNLTLQSHTSTAASTQYTTAPGAFTLLNDGRPNNTGPLSNPNRPFNVPALKTGGWAVVYNQLENDTFLVSTSWLDTTGVAVDKWIITPPISNITGNTVLTWLAKSPDTSYPDGYEVYGTANPGALTPQSFTTGDRLFSIADGNTQGQGEKSVWTRHSINLGGFVGQTLRFAFKHNSKDMYQLWLDDIEVVTLPANVGAAMSSVVSDKYVMVSSSNTIAVNIENTGALDITAIGLNYSINNSSINSEAFTYTPGIAYKQSKTITFALPYSLSSPGLYTIKSWISSVNNAAYPGDTAFYHVTVQSTAPARTVMIEQFVSANDGEGTDAQDKMNGLQSLPAVIVNIHDQDSLMVPGAAPLVADYKKAYSTAMMDRFYYNDLASATVYRPDYGNRFNTRFAKLSPVSVSIINKNYNAATRQVTFTVKADFAGNVKGDYRISAYLTENNVCGPYEDSTLNGFNQVNDYYNIPWSAYYQVGNYLPAANAYVITGPHFKHQNTLIHTFGSPYGLPGTIPSTGGTQGQSYQETFTATLPLPAANVHKFNPDNIYIVGFVNEYSADKNNRTVLNTSKEKLNGNAEFVGIAEINDNTSFSVYPNPSNNGIFYIDVKENNNYELKVFDLFGKCLKAESGKKPGNLDLSTFPGGIYLLTLRSGRDLMTKKIVIQKN